MSNNSVGFHHARGAPSGTYIAFLGLAVTSLPLDVIHRLLYF